MSRVLFRCDASLSIGSGHVIRCRTLARELQRRGCEVLFLSRHQPGDLITLLEKEFRVLALPEQRLAPCESLEGRELYEAWLGCSQRKDADDCLAVLAAADVHSADWVVVDHYGLDATWQSHLLKQLVGDGPTQLLVIDDLADRQQQADLLLDQNFFGSATQQRYQGLVPAHCRQLLGPHYAILGPEYAQLHRLIPNRTELRRVMVFFGGVDPNNLTSKALKALMAPALTHLEVDVVLGQQSSNHEAVADLVAQRPLTNLHGSLPSLAGMIARADLGIGAGGATTWERACLNLPSLVVATAANQLEFAEALHQAGYQQLLGESSNVGYQQIQSALLAWIANRPHVSAGNDLTDGFGAQRLAMAMLGPEAVTRLRPADAGDEKLLCRLVNAHQVRSKSVSPDAIAVSDEQPWVRKNQTDPNRLLFIAMTADGCPIGQIQLNRQSNNEKGLSNEAILELSLDRCTFGHGLVSQVVRLGLQAMEKQWGARAEAVADVHIANTERNACFARAGFSDGPVARPVASQESMSPGHVTLLSDSSSWLNSYLPELISALWQRGHAVRWIHEPAQMGRGDVCLLLSCGHLLTAADLALHHHNLVVHESALPQGQGWSPMTWQIIEGASHIPVSIFEAVAELDAGPIYLQQQIELKGHELVEEWRALQARKTLQLCLEWFDNYNKVVANAKPQRGEHTSYRRRRPIDSQLEPERSIAAQFNLLRCVDNHRYPAFFLWRGKRYLLHIAQDSAFSQDT